MKLSSIILIVSTFICTVLAIVEVWPQTAIARSSYSRRDTPTNAELLKRGSVPSRPRRLYQAKAIQARQAISVPSGGVSRGGRVFNFAQCRDNGIVFGSFYTLTFTNLQDLANQCAEKQVGESAQVPQVFAIRNIQGQDNCYTGVARTTGNTQACDTTSFNAAFYE